MAAARRRADAPARRAHAPGGAVPRADAGVRRARLWLVGSVVLAAVILFAWFPGSSLLSQRSSLAGTEAELASLHRQDGALGQEKKSLSDAGEIGRIAREQYQLVSPGQQAYEVLPPAGSPVAGTSSASGPGSTGPVAPTAASELPPGGVTTTTTRPPSSARATHPGSQPSSGLLARMLRALEFWR